MVWEKQTMKTRHISVGILSGLFFFISCTNAPESDEAKTTEAKEVNKDKTGETWKLDISESTVAWVGTKVTGYHSGNVPLKSGEIIVNNGEVTGGKFVMDVNNMNVSGPNPKDTGTNNKLLRHLKSDAFFDIAKHPEGTFELTGVQAYKGAAIKDTIDPRQEGIGKYKVLNPTHLVSGNLTLRGVTKNIEFPANITVSGNAAQATAKFNIDRKQWGIIYPGAPDDLIRDEVHLGIFIKAIK